MRHVQIYQSSFDTLFIEPGFTSLKIYNGTSFGRLNRDPMSTLLINELKGNLPSVDCPISNFHQCNTSIAVKTKPTVKHNYSTDIIQLIVSFVSLAAVNTQSYEKFCCGMIGLTCAIDMRHERGRDILFHHIFAILLSSFVFIYPVGSSLIAQSNEIIRYVLATEISTIFLVLDHYKKTPKNKVVFLLKALNRATFISTFFYFRIYSYGKHVIFSEGSNTVLRACCNNVFATMQIYVGIYGMFLLNIYWMVRIFHEIQKLAVPIFWKYENYAI